MVWGFPDAAETVEGMFLLQPARDLQDSAV